MFMFLVPVIVLFLISLTGLGYVVVALTPDRLLSVALFLVTFFTTLMLMLSLTIFSLHRKFFYNPRRFTALGPVADEDELRKIYRSSLRRGILVATLATGSLLLNKLGFLTPWSHGILMGTLLLAELYLWRWR